MSNSRWRKSNAPASSGTNHDESGTRLSIRLTEGDVIHAKRVAQERARWIVAGLSAVDAPHVDERTQQWEDEDRDVETKLHGLEAQRQELAALLHSGLSGQRRELEAKLQELEAQIEGVECHLQLLGDAWMTGAALREAFWTPGAPYEGRHGKQDQHLQENCDRPGFSLGIEVTTTRLTHGRLILPAGIEDDQVCSLVILHRDNLPEARLAGWTIARDGKLQQFWRVDPRGPGKGGDAYFVPQAALISGRVPEELLRPVWPKDGGA